MAQIVAKGPLGWKYSGGREKWRKFDRDVQVELLEQGGPNLAGVWIGFEPTYKQEGKDWHLNDIPALSDASLYPVEWKEYCDAFRRTTPTNDCKRNIHLDEEERYNPRALMDLFYDRCNTVYSLINKSTDGDANMAVEEAGIGQGHLLRDIFVSYWGSEQEADTTDLEKKYKAGNFDGKSEKGLWNENVNMEDAFRKMKSLRTDLMSKMTPQERSANSQALEDVGLAKIILAKLPDSYANVKLILKLQGHNSDLEKISNVLLETYNDRKRNGSIKTVTVGACFDCGGTHKMGDDACTEPGAGKHVPTHLKNYYDIRKNGGARGRGTRRSYRGRGRGRGRGKGRGKNGNRGSGVCRYKWYTPQ